MTENPKVFYKQPLRITTEEKTLEENVTIIRLKFYNISKTSETTEFLH